MLLVSLLTACSQVQIPGMGSRNAAPEPVKPQAVEPPLITTLEWSPNYSQPISYLEVSLRAETDSREMNRIITNIAYLYDAQLYVLFHEFLDYLPDTARVREISDQNDWLDSRQDAVSEAFTRNGGGDVGAYHAADMFIAQTRQRAALIEQRLARVRID
ncbi:MAG: hypothetical protein ACK4L8_12225 [Nitrincola lacisaponensis]|uniref:hypothetical protein n=1 Tax=Nitrincola lacisaponensis TaxID=267850 RepID=UPI00391A9ADF